MPPIVAVYAASSAGQQWVPNLTSLVEPIPIETTTPGGDGISAADPSVLRNTTWI